VAFSLQVRTGAGSSACRIWVFSIEDLGFQPAECESSACRTSVFSLQEFGLQPAECRSLTCR
jgi:hypothetical protein